jgi:hypothetical protein
MSESIIFRGTHIRYFDGRQEEGGAFVRIHLTSEFSTNVMAEMDWTDPGVSVTEAKLDGELHGTHLILTPGDKQLAMNEIQFDVRSAEDFKVVTVAEKESKRRELRFVVRTSAPGVAALVDNYIRRVGDHQGALKVSYVKQEQLPLHEVKTEKPKKEKSGCRQCDAGIPFQDRDDSKHVNGEACKLWEQPANPGPPTEKVAPHDAAPASNPGGKGEVATYTPTTEQPNEHGSYTCKPTAIFDAKSGKVTARIEALMIGEDEWISKLDLQSSTSSSGGPISASGPYFPTLAAAVSYQAHKGEVMARSFINQTKGKVAKDWLEVANWLHDQWAGRYADCGFESVQHMADALEDYGVDFILPAVDPGEQFDDEPLENYGEADETE